MKKIGIITIIDYNNYGNRLQNYALQEVIKKFNVEVTTINIILPDTEKEKKRSFTNKVLEKSLPELGAKLIKYIKMVKYKTVYLNKIKKFKEFTSVYINTSNHTIFNEEASNELNRTYDYFISGSDQIWNPIYRKGSPFDFLTFASKNKRIAYAPSFGISKIPKEYEESYKSWLSSFSSLSVREESGAEIIKELTGKRALVVVDPTLILTRQNWLDFSEPSEIKPEKPFLLTYFLGNISKEIKTIINKLSKERNLEVVNLGSYKQAERFATTPNEFVDYIKTADIFLTDSFHGAVFSIIFHKQFIVFNREGKNPDMNSRIDTLLSKFLLLDRKWDSLKHTQDYFDADFSKVDSIVEEEKKIAYKFLGEALELKKEK